MNEKLEEEDREGAAVGEGEGFEPGQGQQGEGDGPKRAGACSPLPTPALRCSCWRSILLWIPIPLLPSGPGQYPQRLRGGSPCPLMPTQCGVNNGQAQPRMQISLCSQSQLSLVPRLPIRTQPAQQEAGHSPG